MKLGGEIILGKIFAIIIVVILNIICKIISTYILEMLL